MYTWISFLWLQLTPIACSVFLLELDEGRIVGGVLASIEKHPYQVSLRLNNRHVCGGAIISEEWVITAAHCVQGTFDQLLSIKAGISDLEEQGTVVAVRQTISHELYNRRSSDYDIALIRLEKPLVFGTRVRPIPMATIGEHYAADTAATVTGWGVLGGNGPLTNLLHKVEVPLVSNADCTRLYKPRTITPRMLCAGYVKVGGKDACQGDSGGPMVQRGKLIGIVSWGVGCAQPSFPGVYTRVTVLRRWIARRTGL